MLARDIVAIALHVDRSHIGVNINALNLYGESALSTAAYHNQIPTVEYLLANGADPKL